LPERVANKVKQKQIKRLLWQPTASDAALRPRVVVLEVLHVDGMNRNRKLALSISDVSLGEFRRQMSYKSVWQGESLLLAIAGSLRRRGVVTSKRRWTSLNASTSVRPPASGPIIDQDLNGALNLAVPTGCATRL